MSLMVVFFFFKQKTAYELRISDWSSDVCSSDLRDAGLAVVLLQPLDQLAVEIVQHARAAREQFDLAAEHPQQARQLDADVAAADDGHPRRRGAEMEEVVRHQAQLRTRDRWPPRLPAGGDHHAAPIGRAHV